MVREGGERAGRQLTAQRSLVADGEVPDDDNAMDGKEEDT
jgi:hypothetical protein